MSIHNETLLTLREVRKHIPTRPSRETVWRWCRKGLRGIRLEYVRSGRTIVTSKEALARFYQALAALDNSDGIHAHHLPPQLTTSHAQAEAALDAAGL